MKKIEYKRPYHSDRYEKIPIYRKLIREALERRSIFGIIFENAPAVNPHTCDVFWCYELLKFENGKMFHATVRCDIPNSAIIFTKEQYEDGFLQKFDEQNNSNWAGEFQNAKWYRWEEVEEQNQYSWDCLYYCVTEAINQCADEDSYYEEEANFNQGSADTDDWIVDEYCEEDDDDFDMDDEDDDDDDFDMDDEEDDDDENDEE